MIYKNTIISLLMFIIISLSIWTTLLTYRPQTTTTKQNANLPDAFMEDVTSIVMDKQGKPKLMIETSKMVHYPEHDTTHFNSPHLTLYRDSPKPWYITSKFAKATEGIENIRFWDDVVIHHPSDSSNPTTYIKTATLTVHPNSQVAETKAFITLIQPNLIMKGIGMHANMSKGSIKLLSQSRGEYIPNA